MSFVICFIRHMSGGACPAPWSQNRFTQDIFNWRTNYFLAFAGVGWACEILHPINPGMLCVCLFALQTVAAKGLLFMGGITALETNPPVGGVSGNADRQQPLGMHGTYELTRMAAGVRDETNDE